VAGHPSGAGFPPAGLHDLARPHNNSFPTSAAGDSSLSSTCFPPGRIVLGKDGDKAVTARGFDQMRHLVSDQAFEQISVAIITTEARIDSELAHF
jgi:hypothetical protein